MGKGKVQCSFCRKNFTGKRNPKSGLKQHYLRFHGQKLTAYDKATGSLLGTCTRPGPTAALTCYVESCDVQSQSGRPLEGHIQKIHNNNAPITLEYGDIDFTEESAGDKNEDGDALRDLDSDSEHNSEEMKRDRKKMKLEKKTAAAFSPNENEHKASKNPDMTEKDTKVSMLHAQKQRPYAVLPRIHPMFTMASAVQSSQYHNNSDLDSDRTIVRELQNKLDDIYSVLERQAVATEQVAQMLLVLTKDGELRKKEGLNST